MLHSVAPSKAGYIRLQNRFPGAINRWTNRCKGSLRPSARAGPVKELPVSKVAPHLLIVDDDKELCSLLSKFLSRHGYRVSVAHNGGEMASILEASRINLVILDLMLPGEDGLVLCRRLRTTSTLPIIMLTAMGEEVDRIIGLEMGADDYLPKGGNPRELLARIRAVLRRAGGPETGAPSGKSRALEFA